MCIRDRVEVVESGVVPDGVAEPRHGLVVAGDGVVAGNAGRKVGGGVVFVDLGCLALAGGLEIGAGTAFIDAQDVGGDGMGVLAEDEVEALGEEGLQHELDVVGRAAAGGAGGDIEAVGLEPGGAGEDVVAIDAVGEGDHIDHGGVVQEVAVAVEGAAGEVGGEGVGLSLIHI